MNFQKLLMEAGEGRQIKIHSGSVEPGDIFVAIPGTKLNGGQFIPEALERGASMVLSDRSQAERYPGKVVVGHENPAMALGELARAHYHTDRLGLSIIGITGTNGKTTTSYLLEHIFQNNQLKTGIIGTVNYRWSGTVLDAPTTTPDCLMLHEVLSRMDKDGVEMVVMEVSSHALAQDRVAGVGFDAGVFTNLSQDHLDYHQDMNQYFQAKSKLFLNQKNKESFTAVINRDDEYGRRLLQSVPRAMSFGMEGQVSDHLQGRIDKNDRHGLNIDCIYKDKSWTIKSALCGLHNGYNLLAAQGAALCMGLEPEQFQCLEYAGQTPGRMEKVGGRHDLDVYIDYAHTPDALEKVCLSVKNMGFNRLIVLFGCGGNRDKSKRPVMGLVASKLADAVFLTSDNPRDEDPLKIIEQIRAGINGYSELYVEPDRRKAIKMAIELMHPGDALIIAGKGHESYQEVKGVRSSFSDAEEAGKVLEIIKQVQL